MMLSVLVWLAMQGQVQQADDFVGQWTTDAPKYEVAKPTCDEGGWISIRREDDTMDKIAVCHDNLWHRYTPPAEHVIEIKTVRDDKKPAVGVEKPAPFRCNVNDGPYLVCITSPVTHWSCADKDHQLTGGFDEEMFIDPGRPNKPYCERVTRELWIDGVRWGVVKGLE